MNARIQHHVTGRLSLRLPQAEALARLVRALQAAPGMAAHGDDTAAILETLRGEFPALEDFERDFPSLCFALATGVGKTRLMGAFISYLHLAHDIHNFFVLAPNLTIYNKLIADFTPNTPKYVFRGIAEFAQTPPLLITGDNYAQNAQAVRAPLPGIAPEARINIFNIAKINSEVRGGKSPRIKRLSEYLGDSYFNYLAELPDLVLLMDESHRYRASAGIRAINELRPLFGLEVTATPFVETGSGKTTPFKNVVMDYPLARALEDGFVKEPAVVTQRGFDAAAHTLEEIEKIKLEDGVRLHEVAKVELLTYARENGAVAVKPFMLVIARDTTHAARLLALIESDLFHGGRYRGKAIQVDSSRKEEETVERLLRVEHPDEPTEIVIHVNMLKEGWDVTNLYTIVPLRAASARTLIEQTIGRGLRLPYGKRTGVEAVDRLSIVAHDKFQEIVDEANRGDSVIRLKQVILEAPQGEEVKTSVTVAPGWVMALGSASPAATGLELQPGQVEPQRPLFLTEEECRVAQVVREVIGRYEAQPDVAPTSRALLGESVQRAITEEVVRRLALAQRHLIEEGAPLDVRAVVAKTTEAMVRQTIDIPRIVVQPAGEVSTGFHPFNLDLSGLHLQPGAREIVGHDLHSNRQFTLAAEIGLKEQQLEDYIVHALVDYDDIDYFSHADLLYSLAGQMVRHLLGYLSPAEAEQVLDRDRKLIAKQIHAQMMAHFWEQAVRYEVRVNRGFTELKPCAYTAVAGQPVRSVRETVVEVGRIKQMLFGGFARCLYPYQKFDSDTERRFAVILERDALKWLKPAKGQFQIYYKLGIEQPEYVPDFVAETGETILMVETKARTDIETAEVKAKAYAAARWCRHASDYAARVGSKPWRYWLIPHDEILESKRLGDFGRFEVNSVGS